MVLVIDNAITIVSDLRQVSSAPFFINQFSFFCFLKTFLVMLS